ncbi:MAG TPA: amino acid permease [Syntrophales bacterium]|nr:amino acid permease [Syntrophales bacterium]
MRHFHRSLKNRHLQMIAIGGAVGTGLFYGSAHVLQVAGPAIVVSYAIVGIAIYFIMRALGEMCVHEPVAGSFSYYAYRYWGDFAGFFAGWNYWFCFIAVSMAELAVIGIYICFWWPGVPSWASALVCWTVITCVNLLRVRVFGEFEFWASLIKVTAIVLMILLGTFLIVSGYLQDRPPAGLADLKTMGDLFPYGIKGLFLSFALVIFSFGGVELLGMAAGEVEHPKQVIPLAIRQLVWRILLFYVGSFAVMLIFFPWQAIGLEASPFVQIFAKSGIPDAASLINLVVITAALSVYNSMLYSNGRMLYNLACQGDAPALFARLSASGIPRNGLIFSSLVTMIIVALNFLIPEKVFFIMMSIASVAILISWGIILFTLIFFRRTMSSEGQAPFFPTPFYPYSIYFTAAFLIITIGLMAFIPDMRPSLIIAPIWIGFLWLIYVIRRKDSSKSEKPAYEECSPAD